MLIHDLYDTGAMNTGDYANDSFIGRAPRPTKLEVKEHIKELVRRAEELEEQELKANSKDVNALYCRGVSRAQFSVYTGLVERANYYRTSKFYHCRQCPGAVPRHGRSRVADFGTDLGCQRDNSPPRDSGVLP